MLQLPPLSLYIHIPWCVRKCPYCDFNSHQSRGETPFTDYTDALLQDLELDIAYLQGRKLQSIFIGGGTPSLMPVAELERLLAGIDRLTPIDAIEITMEANPGTFEQEKFTAFRHAGVNRLSIGIQSFNDRMLQALGRIHGRTEALRAVDIARQGGFDNINLDLMYALPGQDLSMAMADLASAIEQQPEHISWYQLTVEPNTEFYRYPPRLPDEELFMAIQENGQQALQTAAYEQYEISAYAKNGKYSRHNLNYWQFGDYLGIGAGAHGKITLPEQDRIIRTNKTRQPDHYLDPGRSFTAGNQEIPQAELALEFMMNAMRLRAGCGMDIFSARTGLDEAVIASELRQLRARGLIDQDKLAPTGKGQLFLNDLLAEFMA